MPPMSRALTIGSLFILVIPRFAFSDAHPADTFKATRMSMREVHEERDAENTEDCFALGELDISFRTDKNGPPNVGVILSDPRGRRIGFDPLSKNSWQELPQAQGFIDCDALDDAESCWGIVQVCGPLSGTYKLEVIAQQTSAYSLSISARSEEIQNGNGRWSSHSLVDLNNIQLKEAHRDVVLVNYSRDPARTVGARVELPPDAKRNEAHSSAVQDQSTKDAIFIDSPYKRRSPGDETQPVK